VSGRRVVSVHGAHALSGVSTWIAGVLESDETRHDWRALVLGTEAELDAMGAFPGEGTGRVTRAVWPEGPREVVGRLEAARAALRDLGAEVVFPNYMAEGFAAAGLNRRRVVGACHSRDVWYLELFEQASAMLGGAWAVSGECGRLVSHAGGAETARLEAPYGVEMPERVAPLPIERDPSGPVRLLYLGRLESMQKRVMGLVEVARALDEGGTRFELTVAGDGPERGRLGAAFAESGIGGRVRFAGMVDGAGVRSLIDANDALVLVSAYEGTPLAAIEAMAAGRPAALTDGCGGACDVVRAGGGGVIAPAEDPGALGREIAALAASPGRLVELGREARVAAAARFSIGAHVRALEGLIDRVCGSDVRDARGVWEASLRCAALGAERGALDLGEGDVGRWRTAFARRASVDESELCGPVAVERAGARLLAAASEELFEAGCERVAVFPAGRHSARFGGAVERHGHVACFADDSAEPGATLHGKPVMTPARALELGVDGVIVSSDQHEAALESRALAWAAGLPVRTLYVPVRVPAGAASA